MEKILEAGYLKRQGVLYYKVRDLVSELKEVIETQYPFLWVEGEVSNLRHTQPGHMFFNLVDEDAVLKAVVFNSYKPWVEPYVKEGIRVLCFGNLRFYGPSGECRLVVKKAAPVGKGLLALQKEALIQKYREFFDPNRKKQIPKYPKKIVLITSLFGAALRDFLKVSENRWELQILIYPVKVQGQGAEKEIAEAIKDINVHFPDVDLIVITRGGGSVEDLAPFYTEEILIGIKDSKIPVVSAVGHEVDYTICDLIADYRCPTPSAAAEEIIPDKEAIISEISLYRKRAEQLISHLFSSWENRLYQLKLELQHISPLNHLAKLEERINMLKRQLFRETALLIEKKAKGIEESSLSLNKAIKELLSYKEDTITRLYELLFSLSPLNILQKGYSIVKSKKSGKILKSALEVSPGEDLEIRLHKGVILAQVKETRGE